jgi:hypothetical protein
MELSFYIPKGVLGKGSLLTHKIRLARKKALLRTMKQSLNLCQEQSRQEHR